MEDLTFEVRQGFGQKAVFIYKNKHPLDVVFTNADFSEEEAIEKAKEYLLKKTSEK